MNKKYKFLIMDSNEQEGETLKEFLEKKDFDVVKINEMVDALKFLRSNKFDFLLIDLNIPNLDVEKYLMMVKAIPLNREIVIMPIVREDYKYKLKYAISAGADEYLLKPYDFREVQARIDTQISIMEMMTDFD